MLLHFWQKCHRSVICFCLCLHCSTANWLRQKPPTLNLSLLNNCLLLLYMWCPIEHHFQHKRLWFILKFCPNVHFNVKKFSNYLLICEIICLILMDEIIILYYVCMRMLCRHIKCIQVYRTCFYNCFDTVVDYWKQSFW